MMKLLDLSSLVLLTRRPWGRRVALIISNFVGKNNIKKWKFLTKSFRSGEIDQKCGILPSGENAAKIGKSPGEKKTLKKPQIFFQN